MAEALIVALSFYVFIGVVQFGIGVMGFFAEMSDLDRYPAFRDEAAVEAKGFAYLIKTSPIWPWGVGKVMAGPIRRYRSEVMEKKPKVDKKDVKIKELKKELKVWQDAYYKRSLLDAYGRPLLQDKRRSS